MVIINVLENKEMVIKAYRYLCEKHNLTSGQLHTDLWMKEFKAVLIPDKYVPDKYSQIGFASDSDASMFILRWS